jgi:hypothetical protein
MPQNIQSWLMGNRWDARQRASRYKDHVIGEGWQEPFGKVVNQVTGGSRQDYRQVPGFKRETSPAAIKVDDVENMEWPINFAPSYTDKSWRTPKREWKSPATPMISNIKANPKLGIMLVTFGSNGAQFTYDHVPREVIAQLQYAAKSGMSLGREFWDLVRVRGRGGRESSKYPYWEARSPERTEVPQGYKDSLDWAVNEELGLQNTPEAKQMMSADEAKLVEDLSKAYDEENYSQMARLYRKGLNAGLFITKLTEFKGA